MNWFPRATLYDFLTLTVRSLKRRRRLLDEKGSNVRPSHFLFWKLGGQLRISNSVFVNVFFQDFELRGSNLEVNIVGIFFEGSKPLPVQSESNGVRINFLEMPRRPSYDPCKFE